MKKIKEVIVVEGKDDTKQILRAVDADTIETRGSAIPDETMALIKKIAETRGIIVFTDPDFSGEKIRKTISAEIPNAKHAFITKKQGVPKRSEGSLGVEHASVEAIREALSHVYTEDDQTEELISRETLMKFGLMGYPDAKQRREKLGELLGIGYVNGKQLQHRLRMFGISQQQFLDAVEKIDGDK
ncbi:ribonuclease M5 [Lentilactobacillus hilgardii]|uniref:Ribonuclease M5 n=1 Tax=Lentilactobacillus hilgardii TaxID=1588 RepID=A0A6P1EF32_LENHI|nr:ribonuclease M5 [Lentilactobacillus hilgardii]EEI71338.1 ribonuclease M5 [Lentilactobacillus hilgardii ATCC 27305]MCT3393172.1 ribonuclease M5 [Lentilactobacillus hilgardii]QHB52534.1 ribonuclease M5 [Lentilactobacillus hilgardii]RRG08541.1 MAG: ribonuclease M5 [Lactobacillus sp.]